jgi:H+/Cl- antiporter ClcA
VPEGELDIQGLLKNRSYLVLLVFAAIIGAPIAVGAYWYLYLISDLQKWVFDPAYLLKALGFHGEPIWWPVPMVGLAGILVGLTIRYLPGRGGHSPADGFHAGGPPPAAWIPGIALAALAGLALGAVIGPEAPLIALGGGVAAAILRVIKRDAPPQSFQVIGAAGSFTAISTLLSSPLSGAFLLMEASGLGPATGLVLVPGILAAGIGYLIFVGFDAWTGHGTFSLTVPNLPHFAHPDGAELGWAIVIGVAATILGGCIRWLALYLKPYVEKRVTLLLPVVGLVVGGLAAAYAEGTGKSSSDVLFSGQSALPSFLTNTASYSIGALLLLLACKGLAYGASLSGFRGGPIFPSMFIGAVGGVALSHLPGLPMVAGAAMGVGAMMCSMLGLPLTAVLITTIFMGSDGVNAMPLVIVAVVVAYVGRAHFSPRPASAGEAGPAGTAGAAAGSSAPSDAPATPARAVEPEPVSGGPVGPTAVPAPPATE